MSFIDGTIRLASFRKLLLTGSVLALCKLAVAFVDPPADKSAGKPADEAPPAEAVDEPLRPGTVACANLVYGEGKTSVCFSSEFMAEAGRLTNIVTQPKFTPVKLDSPRL